MALLVPRQLGRTDRYVRRARLSLDADAPRHKLAFMVEESLRLCSLPGEEEGRVYYFRYLRVAELPGNGDRQAWLGGFQRAMEEQAAKAVHGLHQGAAACDAVYFHSEREACEALLMLLATCVTPTAWFWNYVSGVSGSLNTQAIATAVVEKLRTTPSGWSAVAAAVFSFAREHDIVALLKVLASQSIWGWLRDLGAPGRSDVSPIRFSQPVIAALACAMSAFGAEAAETLWLASLAVIAIRPSSLSEKSAMAVAQASLQTLMAASSSPMAPPTALRETKMPHIAGSSKEIEADQAVKAAIHPVPSAEVRPRPELSFGEPTWGAGLYFLLNALRRLQVEEQKLSLLFLARLFLCIAAHAGIATDDPILRWAYLVESENEPEEVDSRLFRIWLLKIRRWCWRNGRVSVREIVRRPGYITLTPTDLDVTLYMDSADVRIRRIGLDLDPGWLPWFGRVVRFHYRYHGDHRG